MEGKINKAKVIKTLIVIILILYFVFLCMDLFVVKFLISSDTLKFLSIILVVFISLIIGENSLSPRDAFLLKIGLLFTVMADVLLLLLNSHYRVGIALFCIVQILYNIRYRQKNAKVTIRNFSIIFISLFFIYIFIDKFIIKIDFLIIIAIFYAICLLSSTYKAMNLAKFRVFPNLNSKMIALAMILFLLCDINVALFNIIKTISISNRFTILLSNISSISMWFFYLPSQLLLALSGYKSRYLKDLLPNKLLY